MEEGEKIIALRVQDKQLTGKQLLQRAKVEMLEPLLLRATTGLIVELWAEELGIAVQTAKLQAAVTEFRKTNGLFTAAKAKAWLERRGMELEDLVAYLRPRVLYDALAGAVVSAAEIERYFREHALQFERVEISRIVMEEFGQAQELLFRVEEGADFHALARQYSVDRTTARAGGYVGLVSREEMEPQEAAVLFAASPGDVLGPFERNRTFSLVLLEAREAAKLDAMTSADIRERLFQQKLEAYKQTFTIHEDIWRL